jgi:hypothetical protein
VVVLVCIYLKKLLIDLTKKVQYIIYKLLKLIL